MRSLDFSPEERERYSRNALLPGVGWEGQERWRRGRVLVVGVGGLGSAVLFYLAAAGVGGLRVVDSDRVELSNLQRQILHRTGDLGRPKVVSAQETVRALNPHCLVEGHELRLTADRMAGLLEDVQVAVDASDNFPTRFVLAEACWQVGIPLVSAAVAGFEGQLLVVDPKADSPCYRCLFPQLPPPGTVPGTGEVGILGAVAGVMGCLQAVEALRLLLGEKSELTHKLLSYDGRKARFQQVARVKQPNCPWCGVTMP